MFRAKNFEEAVEMACDMVNWVVSATPPACTPTRIATPTASSTSATR
jgi:acetaldehyde dehydrogenase/alcohol dehydrogenase